MKIVLIVNNKNGRLRKVLPELRSLFKESYGERAVFLFTLRRRHAVELAQKAAEEGCDYLIAVGGDGTLHEVINGVFTANLLTEEHPVIGLLPFGSANDFARTVGIPRSIEAMLGMIHSGRTKKIDAGIISVDQSGEHRYFINIAGAGMGPEVVQRMERSAPVFGPAFHYFSNIVKGFLTYKKKSVICTGRVWKWEGRLLQMAVANGRYFGNGLCATPDADLTDGKFHVAIFGELTLWDYLKNLGNLKNGRKITHPQVSYYTTQVLRIESEEECGIEADGEFVGMAPVTVRVLPGSLRFLVPPDS